MLGDLGGVEKLIAAIGTALAALLTPIGVIYVAAISKKNKTVEDSVTSLREEIEKKQDELDRLRHEIAWERTSGMKWYQEMMKWYNIAHEVRRHALDARQVAESYANLTKDLPKPTWNASIALPELAIQGAFEPMPTKDK
jgi:uncharacterized protein YukE